MSPAKTLLGAIGAASLLWPGGAQCQPGIPFEVRVGRAHLGAPVAQIPLSGLQAPDPRDPMFPHEEHAFFRAHTTDHARQAGHRMGIYIVYPHYYGPHWRARMRIDVPWSFTVLSGETFKEMTPAETVDVAGSSKCK